MIERITDIIYRKLTTGSSIKRKIKLLLQGKSLDNGYFVYKPASKDLSNFRYLIPVKSGEYGGWINLSIPHKYNFLSYNTDKSNITY